MKLLENVHYGMHTTQNISKPARLPKQQQPQQLELDFFQPTLLQILNNLGQILQSVYLLAA